MALGAPFLRPLLHRLVPKQGEGPSREKMLGGSFVSDFVGYAPGADPAQAAAAAKVQVADMHRDPGYWVRAKGGGGPEVPLLRSIMGSRLGRRQEEGERGCTYGCLPPCTRC